MNCFQLPQKKMEIFVNRLIGHDEISRNENNSKIILTFLSIAMNPSNFQFKIIFESILSYNSRKDNDNNNNKV